MKQLSEYKEEIFLRSEKKLAKIKRTRKRIVTSAISLCLCAVVVLVGMTRGRDEIKDNSSGSTSEDNLPIITTIEEDKNGFILQETVPSINEVYLGKFLEEQLELNKGQDVLYRVVIEALICHEDSDTSPKKLQGDRIDYVKALTSRNVIPIAETSDTNSQMAPKEYTVITELTTEEIGDLVKKGGYYIRLAPPGKTEHH